MKGLDQIELRNVEIQNILKRPPPILVRFGTLMICLGIVLLFVISYLIRYPDVLFCEFFIYQENPPFSASAPQNGMVKYMADVNNQHVKQGEVIAVYNSEVCLTDLCKLKACLDQCVLSDSLVYIPSELISDDFDLNDLNAAYLAFLRSMTDYEKKMKGKQSALPDLRLSYKELVSSIKCWEHENIFRSPIDGIITYYSDPQKKTMVLKNDELFVVFPYKTGEIAGKIKLPVKYRDKLKTNRSVVIKSEDYLGESYQIKGQVSGVLFLPDENKLLCDVHITDSFDVAIHKNPFWVRQEFVKAEVVFDERSLLERLFEPMKQLFGFVNSKSG